MSVEVVCVSKGARLSSLRALTGLGGGHISICHWIHCSCNSMTQVLKYLDYVFTGVFTFEMVIKVRMPQNIQFYLSCKITLWEKN